MITKPLDLICINIWRAHLDCCRQINDDRPLWRGRQHLIHGIAHRNGKIQLGTGKTFWGVFKDPLGFRPGVSRFLDQAGAVHRDIANTLSIEAENVLSLHGRGAVVKVNNRALNALECRKGLLNQIGPGLRQHLHGDTLWNTILLDQFAQKRKVVA